MYTFAHSTNYTKEKKTKSSSQFSSQPIIDIATHSSASINQTQTKRQRGN